MVRGPGPKRTGEPAVPWGERLFTAYVRHLAAGGEPERELFDRVWRALAGALRAELRRRGLWTAPPSFLGVDGYANWGEEGALDELTAGAYQFTFVLRLRALMAQSRLLDNVDGLVFRNLRNFVHERQRDGDPLGYQAWETVHAAVEQALAEGLLFVVGEAADGTVRDPVPLAGDSLLTTDPDAHPGADPAPPAAEAARRRGALAALAAQWNAELLPELVTARGAKHDAVVGELARRLPELAAEGVGAVTFRQLLEALRRDLRQRWAAMLWQTRGGLATAEAGAVSTAGAGDDGDDGDEGFARVLVLYRPPLPPEEQFAERESARRLTDCVSRRVEAAEGDERTLSYLAALWGFLRACVAAAEGPPSQRKIASLLGIPRQRLPGLYERLGDMLRLCRRRLRGLAGGEEEG